MASCRVRAGNWVPQSRVSYLTSWMSLLRPQARLWVSAPGHDRMWEDTHMMNSCSPPSGQWDCPPLFSDDGNSWTLAFEVVGWHGVEWRTGGNDKCRRGRHHMRNPQPDRRAPRKELGSRRTISRAHRHAHPAMSLHGSHMHKCRGSIRGASQA